VSPVPIIERQRAISRIGEIRIGGEKGDRAPGKKLEAFRLTSQHSDVIERCASLYGGTPAAWESQTGPAWQLYTDKAALPVLVVVGYSLRQMYELHEGAKCVRRCDGEEEQFSGGPCICNAEGKDACDTITRLMLVLPETGTSLGWQLRSKGENAARELAGAMAIAEELARGRTFVPATLRLTQRRSEIAGQVVRYVVPVLDFDPTQALGPAPVDGELSYTPVAALPSGNGVSLEEGLHAAETQQLTRTARSAAPIPSTDDIPFGTEPVQVPHEPDAALPAQGAGESASTASAPQASGTSEKPLTLAGAKKKLNALVGQLRESGNITTEQLYSALAKSRNIEVDLMLDLPSFEKAYGTDGALHWAPLRDTLTREEANELHGRLARLWVNVGAMA
jgi:hypothetical protein